VQYGELEQKLGEARHDLIAAATKDFLQPLHTFLDGDMKTVQVQSIGTVCVCVGGKCLRSSRLCELHLAVLWHFCESAVPCTNVTSYLLTYLLT